MSTPERIVITGMSINTPLGDTLDGFLKGLLAGKSAITNWKTLDVSRCYSKVGADLSEYDIAAKLASLESKLDNTTFRRARKLISRAPWTTKLSVLLALDAFLDANTFNAGIDMDRVAGIVAGHNVNFNYHMRTVNSMKSNPISWIRSWR